MCGRQLHACLDHPDRICAAACGNPGKCGGGKVHGSSLDSIIELISYHLLSITIREEVDRAGGYYTNQRGPQTLEQRWDAFKLLYFSVECM